MLTEQQAWDRHNSHPDAGFDSPRHAFRCGYEFAIEQMENEKEAARRKADGEDSWPRPWRMCSKCYRVVNGDEILHGVHCGALLLEGDTFTECNGVFGPCGTRYKTGEREDRPLRIRPFFRE